MNLLSARLHGRTSGKRAKVSLPLVELDRWQLSALVLLMLVLSAGAFFLGVEVGKGKNAPVPERPALAVMAQRGANAEQRHMALAEVWPPTQDIDRDLAQPLAPPLPSDPTERARAQAHLQLQESRSAGLRNDVPAAVAAPVAAPPMVVAEGVASGFTLQVSLFDTHATANAVATELLEAGHPVRIRQVQTAEGRALFRVEIGQFPDAQSANAYQRQFERDSGYSAVRVPL